MLSNRIRLMFSSRIPWLWTASCLTAMGLALASPAAVSQQTLHQATAKTWTCGWTTTFQGSTSSDPSIASLGCDHYYIGDFNGDGVDEVLTVDSTTGSTSKMSVVRYNAVTHTWATLWSLSGDPHDGGIYDYRGELVVGDFDGDGKDEVLGIAPGQSHAWITMFNFEGNQWVWGWSNGGDESAGEGIYPYRHYLTAGHFMHDGRDELLGGGGWVTMFRFDGVDFRWTWSSGPSHAIVSYALTPCYAGDLNGDGQDDVIYVSSTTGSGATWATSFYWTGSDWLWGWSNGTSSGTIVDWQYPLQSDRLLVGNIDYDASDELLFLQRTYNGTWEESMQFPVGAGYLPPQVECSNDAWGWMGTWNMSGGVGTLTDYYLMRTGSGPKSVLARRHYSTPDHYALVVLHP